MDRKHFEELFHIAIPDKFKYIAGDNSGQVYAYVTEPDFMSGGGFWWEFSEPSAGNESVLIGTDIELAGKKFPI